MVRRTCCVPGVVLSFCAAVLLVLCTVSTPLSFGNSTPFSVFNAYDLSPNLFDYTNGSNPQREITALSGGTWGYCSSGVGESSGMKFCNNAGTAYYIDLRPARNDSSVAYTDARIEQSWTRGLVVVVVAFVFSILSLATALVPNLLVLLISSILHLITALLALIAFVIALVCWLYARNRIHRVSPGATVTPGVQFYLTLISIPLLVMAGITVCCGRREKDSAYDYSSETKTGSGRFGGGGLFKRKDRRANNSSVATGGYRETTGGAEDGIPLDSRQKVLSAFEQSRA